MPDRQAALVQYLQADAGLAGILKGRVYDEELPDNVVSRMPIPCVLVMSSAGARNIGAPTTTSPTPASPSGSTRGRR